LKSPLAAAAWASFWAAWRLVSELPAFPIAAW